MGKKGTNAAGEARAAAAAASEVERMKKVCLNCGKEGSGKKKFSKWAFCEFTRYCSRDCQRVHWKVRLDERR